MITPILARCVGNMTEQERIEKIWLICRKVGEGKLTRSEAVALIDDVFKQAGYVRLVENQNLIHKNRMRNEEIHNSHLMTEWRTEIRCPCDTPRFYGVRNCTQCNGEELQHPAGHFVDEWLYDPCVADKNIKEL